MNATFSLARPRFSSSALGPAEHELARLHEDRALLVLEVEQPLGAGDAQLVERQLLLAQHPLHGLTDAGFVERRVGAQQREAAARSQRSVSGSASW